jgi:hypothetical protein
MPETAPLPAEVTPAAAPVAATASDPAADFDKQWSEFKPPEGFTVDGLKPLVEWAQKAGLDPKATAAVALREREAAAKEEADFKHLSEKGWLEELTKDPELGGPKIRETMVDVMRATDRLDPKVQALIKEQGILYNPVVVRILHDIGTKLREDNFVRPGATPAQGKAASADERFVGMFK